MSSALIHFIGPCCVVYLPSDNEPSVVGLHAAFDPTESTTFRDDNQSVDGRAGLCCYGRSMGCSGQQERKRVSDELVQYAILFYSFLANL